MAVEILIVKLSSLGDLFHALPAVHALKMGLNASRVDWVTQPAYRDMVECFADVDEIFEYPREGFFRNYPAFRRLLRARKYDYVFDMQGLFKSGLVAKSARADRRIGPFGAREGARCFYDEAPAHGNRHAHAVDRLWEVVPHLDLVFDDKKFPLQFPAVEIPDSQETSGGPRIALAPLSRWGAKDWPLESFVALADRLKQEHQASVYVIGDAKQKALVESITAACNVCGAFRLPETGSLLQQMDVLVTNDSGPMHIASAVGTPVVALFGPTDPRLTGPYGDQHIVLRSAEAEAQGPGHHGYKSPDNRLMQQISVDEVFAAVSAVLAR